MLPLGQSRHFDSAPRTSALPRSADIAVPGASGPKSATSGRGVPGFIPAIPLSEDLQ
jgi:hypothetical protein